MSNGETLEKIEKDRTIMIMILTIILRPPYSGWNIFFSVADTEYGTTALHPDVFRKTANEG